MCHHFPVTPPVLYHVPPSFYSQVARLVLAEAEVDYVGRYAVAGPPLYETYAPWYLELNPGGTVPTLVIGEEALDDSRLILHEVDARFAQGRLTPKDEALQAEVNEWLDRAYDLPERVFAYSSQKLRRVGARVNRGRRDALLRQKAQNPGLAEIYDAKIADIEDFMREASEDTVREELERRRTGALDELEASLAQCSFLVGDAYSLADLMWTVTIARQFMLGEDPLVGRPWLAQWYTGMKARPSFARADVWEKARPHKMLPMVWDKFPLVVVAAVLVLVAAVVLIAAGVYARL